METTRITMRLHRLPLSNRDFAILRDGGTDSVWAAEGDYHPGDFVCLFDRRDLHSFAIRRLRSAVPEDMERPDRVRLRFCPGAAVSGSVDNGNIYDFGEDYHARVQLFRGRGAALRRV